MIALEPVVDAPSESLCLPGQGLTLTELLRVLDVLRRRLARSTRGREGAFAGFDVLDVSRWRDGAETTPIRFTARVVTDDRSSQVVEYAAVPCAHPFGTCSPVEPASSFVTATGRTVGLGRPAARTSPGAGFAIAAPHR